MGTYRFVRPWLGGIVVLSAAAVAFYLWMNSILPALGSLTALEVFMFEAPVFMFIAFAAGCAVAVALMFGAWSLSVSESGIRIVRGGRPPREIPWARMTRVRWGPVAVKVSRYRTDLAEGIWLDVRGGRTRRFDTARFRVRTADLDAMAAAIREAAGRHAIPVEPFPMMGRERF